jgi:acetyl esterase/lipase
MTDEHQPEAQARDAPPQTQTWQTQKMNNKKFFPALFKTTNVAILLLILSAPVAPAQTKKTMELWSDGAPGANGKDEKDKPKLFVRIPKNCNETAIIILPGGGYGHLAMGHEGHEIAEWFNSKGIAAFICDYRHRGKGYGHPAPMQDAQRAIRTVRANAKTWGIDPDRIGVIGFSAGGHLCSTVSNHFDDGNQNSADLVEQQNCRPDFAILCYPVIALGEEFTHQGSQRNLLGEQPAADLIKKFSNEKQVTKNTPPSFIWHTAADRAVKVENSLRYFAALNKNNVAAELHVFPQGRHGLGMAKKDKHVSQWTSLCEKWLTAQGLLPEPKQDD